MASASENGRLTDAQRVWHPELHLSFVSAVQQLGVNTAVAKTVLSVRCCSCTMVTSCHSNSLFERHMPNMLCTSEYAGL